MSLNPNFSIVMRSALSKRTISNMGHGRDPHGDFQLPSMHKTGVFTAPIPGFVSKGSPLHMVCLELLRDDYNILHKSLRAKDIVNVLKDLPENGSVHLKILNGGPIGLSQLFNCHVYDAATQRFCNFSADSFVGVRLPLSDYGWVGLNSHNTILTLCAVKVEKTGKHSVDITFDHFNSRHVECGLDPAAWSVYYTNRCIEADPQSALDTPSKDTIVRVEVREQNDFGNGSSVLEEIDILTGAVPSYLVCNRSGNVYKVHKTEQTFLRVSHIGYVPATAQGPVQGPCSVFYDI